MHTVAILSIENMDTQSLNGRDIIDQVGDHNSRAKEYLNEKSRQNTCLGNELFVPGNFLPCYSGISD